MKKLIFILVVGMMAGCGDSNYVEPTTALRAGGTESPIRYGDYSSSQGRFHADGTHY